MKDSLPRESSLHRPLRLAVVGLGARSHLALKALSSGVSCQIVAVADPHPAAQARAQKLLGNDRVPVFASVSQMLAEGLDAAFVLSPDDTHAEVACELLEAGVATYLEKPLAISLEGANRILETAYRSGTRLYLGHNMRHMQVVRILRQIVRDGAIGELKAIWCRHFVGSGGDFYFKDWHAQRRHVNSLLLQKAAHDIDVMHWIADSHAQRVVAMGELGVYNRVTDRAEHSDELMPQWHSLENWPPLSQRGLAPEIDVEDLSMLLMRLENGVHVSYQQCHYTPDYWRNYVLIGTEGRAENFGDGQGGRVVIWNRRTYYNESGNLQIPITGDENGHDDADQLTVNEFLNFVLYGAPTDTSPLDAWYAVAAGIAATDSLRNQNLPQQITAPAPHIQQYFRNHQRR